MFPKRPERRQVTAQLRVYFHIQLSIMFLKVNVLCESTKVRNRKKGTDTLFANDTMKLKLHLIVKELRMFAAIRFIIFYLRLSYRKLDVKI